MFHGRIGLAGVKDVRIHLRDDLSFHKIKSYFIVYLPGSGNRFNFDFENDIFRFA